MINNTQAEDIFTLFLKSGKNRITPERFEIMRAALSFDGHFTADTLYLFLKNKQSRVSRATVYNTLELLTQCQLVKTRNFGDSIKHYESGLQKQNHDHLICLDCGGIIEIENTGIQQLQNEICERLGFTPASYSFNIYAHATTKSECPHPHGK